MASNLRPHAVVFIITGIFFLASAVNSIPTEELDSMLDTLRIRGYRLFCNAIVTSDIQFELISGKNDTGSSHSYTFFAPIDSSLFALDMTLKASSYIDTLRFHIVPGRLSITDLLRLPAGTSLPTLLFRRHFNVTQRPGSVSVGGVNVAFPGLFYGRHVAVHGLNGIISLRSSEASGAVPGSPVGIRYRRSSSPRSGFSSSEIDSLMAPNPAARPPGENIPPVNGKPHSPAHEPTDATSHFHAAPPFHQAVHPPEQSNPLDDLMIFAPDGSPFLADAPFNPPESDKPNSQDKLMIHASKNSHSHAGLVLNRAVDAPESDEPNSLDDIVILAPEDSHSYAALQFKQAAHPPESDKPNSLDDIVILAPEDGQVSAAPQFDREVLPPEPNESSSLGSPMIPTPEFSHFPASTTESSANVFVLPPVVSHALTPTTESLEYRYSSISAPPLEYSNAEVPTAMGPYMWPPNAQGVALIETSDGPIKMRHYADEVPKMPQPLNDAQEMPRRYKPLDGASHCVDPDVGLGLEHYTHQCTTYRFACE